MGANTSKRKRILWIDDEIEILEPLVLGRSDTYDVVTATNGIDGTELFIKEDFDLVILDEQMPGMCGLEALDNLKAHKPHVPVFFLTKSESQDMADKAISHFVDNFFVKPINIPTLKSQLNFLFNKNGLQLARQRENFCRSCSAISFSIGQCNSFADWAELYQRVVELELLTTHYPDLASMPLELKKEANARFAKFIMVNYEKWCVCRPSEAPLFSHRILSEKVKPLITAGQKVALIVIDNFRLDQWMLISNELKDDFDIKTDIYCSILPTSTQYSRNAIFAGMWPADIKNNMPQYWSDGESEGSLNKHERELLESYFSRQKLSPAKTCSYYKVGDDKSGMEYIRKFGGYTKNALNALVFNFVDELSHKGIDVQLISDLTLTDAAYRSVTLSWFQHGVLKEILNVFGNNGYKIILTTDHGAIRVSNPVTVTGTAAINSNTRFKVDSNLTCNYKDVLEISDPAKAGLPKSRLSDKYIFAVRDDFFVYPNNRAEYVDKFQGKLQHGGISLEEMLLPLATLTKK